MARYIDIEGAGIGKVNREQFLVPEFADGWNAVLKILEKAPTADVVEVVRCEKCVNRIGISVTGEVYCSIHDVSVPLDYYCGSGRGAEPTTENKVKETVIRIVSGPHKEKKRKRWGLK